MVASTATTPICMVLLELAKKAMVWNKYMFIALLDGRDVPPSSGIDYVAELQQQTGRNRSWQNCYSNG